MRAPLHLFAFLVFALSLLGCKQVVDESWKKPIVPTGFDESLLTKLKCPENQSALRFANQKELNALNQRIGAGNLKTWTGSEATEPVEALLIREDGKIGYRLENIRPNLLIPLALVLDESVGPPDVKKNRN